MKKLLIVMWLLIIVTVLWSAENGMAHTRSNSADLTRFLVENEHADAGSEAGFKAWNDEHHEMVLYMECAADGSNVWITNDTGNILFDVPTGKGITLSVNEASVFHVDASGITVGTWIGSVIDETYGGTGLSNPTDHFVLIGAGNAAITQLDITADGSILVGAGAATDPVALAVFTSSTGDLIHEAGGMEADVSGYTDGLYGQITGDTQNINTKAEMEVAVGLGVGDLALTTGDSFSGDHDWTSAIVRGASPFVFEGSTDDTFNTTFAITDPTTPSKTITFQDHDGIVVMDASICYDLEGTNLSIAGGTLNAVLESIDAGNYLHFWATGNTQNDETDNWRVSAGATDLIWEYCSDGGVPTWVTKETKTP